MKVEEVERLLVQFYEGNTTEEEESSLIHFFRTEEVSDELSKDQQLFLFLYQQKEKPSLPEGLENKLNCLIDEKAEEERRFFHRNRSQRNWKWVGSIAASLLLLVAIAYSMGVFREEMRPPTPEDTFSNPELAYEVLESTLMEVSTNLNKGVTEVKKTQQDIHKVTCEVKKEITKKH